MSAYVVKVKREEVERALKDHSAARLVAVIGYAEHKETFSNLFNNDYQKTEWRELYYEARK